MDYQRQQDFFAWEAASHDTIDFKTVYVDMADDLMAGLLLSQLVYWHLPKKDGSSRMRVSRDGNLWVAKTRTEWWAETRLKPRQVDRAGKILVKKGLVFTNLWKFAGLPTTHWRINWNAFLPSLKKEAERWKENCILPKREIQQTKALLTNDETVTSFLTETVAENAAQIDPPAQNSPIGEPTKPDPSQTPPPQTDPPTETEPATPGGQPDNSDTTSAPLTEPQPAPGDVSASDHEYMPDHVSPPGETLLEKIEELGMSQSELARQAVGWCEETVNEIVQGKTPITPEIALQLERVLGIPAGFWNNREQQYCQYLAQKKGSQVASEPPSAPGDAAVAAPDEYPDDEPQPLPVPGGITDTSAPSMPPAERDYLTDLFAYAKRQQPGEKDTHVRPRHWETVSDDEYAICRRVAQLWCGGRLPFPGSIEAHCGAAGWLLHDLNGGNLGACVRALDEYHLHYEQEKMTFTVAGPKSLVAVLPAFLAQEGGGGEAGVIRVGG